MPSRRLATVAILTGLSFTACAKKDTRSSSEKHADTPQPMVASVDATKATTKGDENAPTSGLPGPTDKRKVIRTGQIDLVIASYEDTRDKLAAIVKQAGGYIDSTEVAHQRGAVSSATIVLRIPSEGFPSILTQLRALGEITAEHTNAADVTAEYVDIDARLASAKVLEKRLLQLAAERTGTVENVLAVERELARVRGEIEGFEGKLRQWNDQIAMSTLTLGLSTRAPELTTPDKGFGQRVSDGLTASVEALRDFGSGLAIVLVALLPWLAFAVPGFFIGRRAWRRYTRHRIPLAIAHSQSQPPPPPSLPSEAPPDRS